MATGLTYEQVVGSAKNYAAKNLDALGLHGIKRWAVKKWLQKATALQFAQRVWEECRSFTKEDETCKPQSCVEFVTVWAVRHGFAKVVSEDESENPPVEA